MYIYEAVVEFEDVDSYGIAHHTKILSYLERARVHFFIDNGIKINDIPFGLIVRKINIQYKQPLFLLEKIHIELKVKSLNKMSFEWEYKIKKQNKIAVYAIIEQTAINIKEKKLIPIPSEIKTVLESILIK